MTDFKAKIHQIRFQLGLHPRPSWGNLQRSPDPLVGFGGRFAAGEGLGWGTGGKGEGKGRDGEVEGREREGPQVTVEPGPLSDLLRHCFSLSKFSQPHLSTGFWTSLQTAKMTVLL